MRSLTEFEDLIRQKKPDLRPASVRSYVSILRAFLGEERDLDESNDLIDFIGEPESIFSRKTRASHLLSWLRIIEADKTLISLVNNILSDLNAETAEHYRRQTGSKHQMTQGGSYVNFEEIQKIGEELKDKIDEMICIKNIRASEFRALRNSMLIRLQIETRLRRDLNTIVARFHSEVDSLELADKVQFAMSNKINFYDIGTGRLYIFNHKMSNKTHEPIVVNLSDEMKEQVNRYITHHLQDKATLLFPQSHYNKDRLNPMRKDTISSLIRKNVFQKLNVSGGTTAIRHSYLSSIYKPDESPLDEQEAIARSMGHTQPMAQRYALKRVKAENPVVLN